MNEREWVEKIKKEWYSLTTVIVNLPPEVKSDSAYSGFTATPVSVYTFNYSSYQSWWTGTQKALSLLAFTEDEKAQAKMGASSTRREIQNVKTKAEEALNKYEINKLVDWSEIDAIETRAKSSRISRL